MSDEVRAMLMMFVYNVFWLIWVSTAWYFSGSRSRAKFRGD